MEKEESSLSEGEDWDPCVFTFYNHLGHHTPTSPLSLSLSLLYFIYFLRKHTAVKIAPCYSAPTIYVRDASKSVVVVRKGWVWSGLFVI